MAITRKEEDRALNADEREIVNQTRHPVIQDIPDADLLVLQRRLREQRNKARTLAHQKRREMRGKGAARGVSPSQAYEGSKLKFGVLSMAMKRLNAESQRRAELSKKHSLVENAQKALELKKQAETDKLPFNTRHAHKGMRNIPNERAEDLIRPMERGRLKKAAGVAQAKRDSM
ncbi:hypothetical protein AAIB41_11175 [Brucella sp. BE17]|uniref:hypothetical protein n=1 Tax=Brucella sp. BE17 TaxID=3142977 RepID=UPI0031BB4B0A